MTRLPYLRGGHVAGKLPKIRAHLLFQHGQIISISEIGLIFGCRNQQVAQLSIAHYSLINQFYQMEMNEMGPNNSKDTICKSFRSTKRDKLWQQSQNTIPFVCPQLSFYQQKRFKWSSIYWPAVDDGERTIRKKQNSQTHEIATKISKMIDQEQKNEMRNKQAKRTTSQHKSMLMSAKKQSISSPKQHTFFLNNQAYQIVNKLATVEKKKQSTLRDRHGNRCNLWEDPQEQNSKDLSYLAMSTGFKTSRKVDLDLPHNFYPGPGTYQIKRFLSDQDKKSFEPAITKREFPKIAKK